MDDFDDIEDVGEELGDELEDEVGRRGMLAGLVAVLGAGGAGYYFLMGGSSETKDGSSGTQQSGSGDSGPAPLSGDVTGTPAPGYVESFEDGTLDEYDAPSSGAAIDSEQPYHGDGALHLRTADGPVSVSTDSLDSLPSAGDSFRYRFYPTPVKSDGGANLTFGLDDNGKGYQINCSFWKSFFALSRKDSDSRTTLAKTDVSYEGGQWYVVDVGWNEGDLSLTLSTDSGETLAELSAADDTYASGGLRFTAWANTYRLNVFYDAVEIR